MKYLKLFEAIRVNEQQLIVDLMSLLKSRGWSHTINNRDSDHIGMFTHNIDDKYGVMVNVTKLFNGSGIRANLYLVAKNSYHYIDNIFDPISNSGRKLKAYYSDGKLNINIMYELISVAKANTEYFEYMDKYASEDDIRSIIEESLEHRFESYLSNYTINDIRFGYVATGFPTNAWDKEIYWQKDYPWHKPIYAIYLSYPEHNSENFTHSHEVELTDEIVKDFDKYKNRLGRFIGLNFKIHANISGDGLSDIIITAELP